MKAAPRSVRRLWTALGALLVLGLVAYVRFLMTGSYDLFIALFSTVGAAFFVLVTATEVYFTYRARSQFEPGEPMRTTWTLVFLSACCRLAGTSFAQILSAKIVWNPLVILKAWHPEQSSVLHDLGIVMAGPVALAFLAAGLMRAVILTRRLGVLGRLTWIDKSCIAVILVFTISQLFEIGGVLLGEGKRPGLAQVLLWFSDPLLTLLLILAVAIRRSVLNMGHGLVARCWGMMALGVAFTSAGDAMLWAEWHGFLPTALLPLGWFVWFFAVTAFASAPCYQMEATRLAHAGSYSALSTQR
jgi:hypothetical protein